ncbi:MAG: AI-2E family transporter [Alphaproteobacteria bacterium]|nr:AI-2E family transporter [Alphaproteobacteria bacterium]
MELLKKSFLTKEQKTILSIGILLFVIGIFLYSISEVLLPFVLAFVLAYFLHPAVQALEKYKIPRWLATTVVMALFMIFILAVILIVVPILQTQIMMLMGKIPAIVSAVWEHIQTLIVYTRKTVNPEQLSNLSAAISKTALNVLNSTLTGMVKVISGGFVFFNLVSMFMITPIILFYVLRDWQGVENQMEEFIPEKNKKDIKSLWSEINSILSGFIRGQSLVCLSLGVYYGIGLSLVGLEYGLLVGFLAGILSFIPYFGFLTGLLLSVILGISMHASLGLWIGMAVVFILGQILEGYVLTPKLVGDKVGLHPVWVIFALFAGGALSGFVGILIAVPVAAVIGVLIRRTLKWYHNTSLYKGLSKKTIESKKG